MLVNFTEDYITVFATKFSYRYNVFTYWTTRSGACYKNGYTRPNSRTFTTYENALWPNRISWINTSSTKLLESGEKKLRENCPSVSDVVFISGGRLFHANKPPTRELQGTTFIRLSPSHPMDGGLA